MLNSGRIADMPRSLRNAAAKELKLSQTSMNYQQAGVMPMLDSYTSETAACEPHLAAVYSAVFSSLQADAVEGVEFQNDRPRFHLLLQSVTGRSHLWLQLGRNGLYLGFVFVCDLSRI